MMIYLAMFGMRKSQITIFHMLMSRILKWKVRHLWQMGLSELLYANDLSHLLWNCVKLLEEKP